MVLMAMAAMGLLVLLKTGPALSQITPQVDNAAVSAAGPQSSTQARTAIIIYDPGTDLADAHVLQDLLGHFYIESDVVADSDYAAGGIARHDIAFYINRDGHRGDRPVPPALLADIGQANKPTVWMGFGFDQLSASTSMERFGYTFDQSYMLNTMERVLYKNSEMTKRTPGAELVTVTDPEKATVFATMSNGSRMVPYIVRGGNLWHIADVPLDDVSQFSAYMALTDLLHDMVGSSHSESHQALLRIEDVHPGVNPDDLRAIADYLFSQNIPFSVALIPVYFNEETGVRVSLSEKPAFVDTIRYMQARGADIVLHGYTHQYSGETAVDYEFWNDDTASAPDSESEGWIKKRMMLAFEECWNNGIKPVAWETPHYKADDFTNAVIARNVPVYYGRRDQVFYPYVIERDRFGQKLIPETIGYVYETPEAAGTSQQIPSAGALTVVRDGVDSAFFHPFLELDLLKRLTASMRADGYKFVSLESLVGIDERPHPIDMSYSDYVASWYSEAKAQLNVEGPLSFFTTKQFAIFISIFVTMYYWGIFMLSRRPAPPSGPADPGMRYVIVIPCLNEELVLARTLDHLMSLPEPGPLIMVVNDDSEDRTRDIALEYPRDRVLLVDHPRAVARQGKGKVLNYAFRYLMKSDFVREVGPHKVVMGVLDADGRAEPHIIEAIAPYFADDKAAAVQVGVRISNADTNALTKWQNFEFLTFARISQKAREHLGSVGLGGNGQFVRLSALASLGRDPWTDCLTEDLDLGLRLMMAGWANHYSPDSFVAQQGVPKLKPLIRQRTRWFQGHLSCWHHIPALFASHRIRALARTDTIYYLLAPSLVFFFMPASIMFIIGTVYLLLTGATSVLVSPLQYLPAILMWYLFSFGALPAVVWTFYREEKEIGPWRAFLWAHVFSFFYVIWFVAGCKAIWRLARGQGSWAKTARTAEDAVEEAVL